MTTRSTGAAAGIGGPGVISGSGVIQNNTSGLLTANDGGGGGAGGAGGASSWTVASAAKLIFGRARSLSTPSSPATDRTAIPNPHPTSPHPLSRHTQPEDSEVTSPTGSVMSIPMSIRAADNHIAPARLYPPNSNSSAPSVVLTSPQSSRRNSIDIPPTFSPNFPTGAIKTLCNRGSAILSVHLAEPVLFLTGFEPSEYTDRTPAMLRGSLILKLLKPAKIKTITLIFRGRARTDWPEGIPPKKTELQEEKDLMTHTWPFFNAQFTSSEVSHGADAARLIDSQRLSMDLSRASMDSVSSLALSDNASRSNTPTGSPKLNASYPSNALWGIPFGQSQSCSKDDKTLTQSRGYRLFSAGEYT